MIASTMFIPGKRWLYCCLFFLYVTSCQTASSYNNYIPTHADSLADQAKAQRALRTLDSIQALVRTGDLVTRTGNDFTSESLRKLNQQDQTYSHCGIASIEHDSLFVYHALGGEFNPDQKIRRDAFVFFGEPGSNRGIGIFRFNLPASDTTAIQQKAQQFFHAGIMFDMDFDLASNDRMYCAEFVAKTYSSAVKALHFDTSRIGQFVFIGVDNLFRHPQCQPVYKTVYH